jgi:hypothetical protein
VADLAAAVSGQKEGSGIEERGQVVVIGGVRVKVKSQDLAGLLFVPEHR